MILSHVLIFALGHALILMYIHQFGKTWAEVFDSSIRTNMKLNAALGDVSVSTPFPGHRSAQRLKLASKLMKTKDILGHERQLFFFMGENFDTHSNQNVGLDYNLPIQNRAIQQWVTEMKTQGIWDDVVLVLGSDFGRGIYTNSNGGTEREYPIVPCFISKTEIILNDLLFVTSSLYFLCARCLGWKLLRPRRRFRRRQNYG